MSVGLIVTLIVLIAVVLSLAVDNDDPAPRTSAPAAPLSYYVEGAGNGLINGLDEGIAPTTAQTTESRDFRRVPTNSDIAVNRPTARYEEGAGEGLVGGNIGLTVVLPSEEQLALTNDEIMFREWNDPLGWQAIPAPAEVTSYADMLFWEQNVYFGDGAVADEQPVAKVESSDRTRFIAMNTDLPGTADDTRLASDRQGFTQF